MGTRKILLSHAIISRDLIRYCELLDAAAPNMLKKKKEKRLTSVVAVLCFVDEVKPGCFQLRFRIRLFDGCGYFEAGWRRYRKVDVLLQRFDMGICHLVHLEGDMRDNSKKSEGTSGGLEFLGIIDGSMNAVHIDVFDLANQVAERSVLNPRAMAHGRI
jgi:hypothetical protein